MYAAKRILKNKTENTNSLSQTNNNYWSYQSRGFKVNFIFVAYYQHETTMLLLNIMINCIKPNSLVGKNNGSIDWNGISICTHPSLCGEP